MTYYIKGGVYTDTSFTTLVGDEEIYGPFTSYKDAHDVWSAQARSNIDTCCHRLTIITVGE